MTNEVAAAPEAEQARVIDAFHDLYYNGRRGEGPIFQRTRWLGVQCLKCPLDLWIYQELLHELRPDLVIETGTHEGGSALFLAHVMDALGHGRIASIDVRPAVRPTHHRITYVLGSSTDPEVVRRLPSRPGETCLVILDSDHSQQHVEREMDLLAPLVSVGSYMIVEDTNINGHPTYQEFGAGPMEAVQAFLALRDDFVVDRDREKFLLTFNPQGFLKRVR